MPNWMEPFNKISNEEWRVIEWIVRFEPAQKEEKKNSDITEVNLQWLNIH